MSIFPGPVVSQAARTWSIDHAAKTINVKVNIAFWPIHSPRVSPSLVAKVIEEIGEYWGGLYYKCYRFIVTLDAIIVDGPDKAPEDYFDVGLDAGPVRIRSDVYGRGGFFGTKPLSDSPSDRFDPRRGQADDLGHSTVWSARPETGLFAHEFGHLLGADDGYVEGAEQKKVPCHTDDLMGPNMATRTVSPQMVATVVHRSGLDVSGVKCPMEFRAGPSSLEMYFAELKDLTVVARCDDYPAWSDDSANQEPAVFTGTLSLRAGYLMGEDNADARAFLEKLGVPAGPLSDDWPLTDTIRFSLTQPRCDDKDKNTHPRLYILAPGVDVEGTYSWAASSPVPHMNEPMTVNGLSTDNFVPGPSLQGRFIDVSGTP